MVSPNRFWEMEDELDNPPLTDEMLAFAEATLGVRLPEDYVSLLRIRNGGRTNSDDELYIGLKRPTRYEPDSRGLEFPEMNGIGPPDREMRVGAYDILMTPDMIAKWELPAGLVLLDGDGHTWFALDYRKEATPRVIWIESTDGEEVEVGRNFSDFLRRLKKGPVN
jgi:hypothetical protein